MKWWEGGPGFTSSVSVDQRAPDVPVSYERSCGGTKERCGVCWAEQHHLAGVSAAGFQVAGAVSSADPGEWGLCTGLHPAVCHRLAAGVTLCHLAPDQGHHPRLQVSNSGPSDLKSTFTIWAKILIPLQTFWTAKNVCCVILHKNTNFINFYGLRVHMWPVKVPDQARQNWRNYTHSNAWNSWVSNIFFVFLGSFEIGVDFQFKLKHISLHILGYVSVLSGGCSSSSAKASKPSWPQVCPPMSENDGENKKNNYIWITWLLFFHSWPRKFDWKLFTFLLINQYLQKKQKKK